MNRGYRVSGFGRRPVMAGDYAGNIAALEAQWRSHEAWVAAGRPVPPVVCESVNTSGAARCSLCAGHAGDHFAATDDPSLTRHWSTSAERSDATPASPDAARTEKKESA